MEAQRNELIKLAEANGWKVTELDNYDFQRWSMETWLLESLWSPIGATAYVSFLINEECISSNLFAWAIEVSGEKPVWGKERTRFIVSLTQWKNKKNDFLSFLSEVRNKRTQMGENSL
jgi:hypothetical protein